MTPRREVVGSNLLLGTSLHVAEHLAAYLRTRRSKSTAALRALPSTELLGLCQLAFRDSLRHDGESGAARVKLGSATMNAAQTADRLRFGCDAHGVFAWWDERVKG